MNSTVFKLLILSIFVFFSVSGNGEFSILHHPKNLIFKGHETVRESILTEVYSATLGFTTGQTSNWEGLYIRYPFDLAEAVVTVAIDGITDIGYNKAHNFALKTDVDESDIFLALQKRLTEHYAEENSRIIRVNLANGLEQAQEYDILKGIKNDKPHKSLYMHLKNDVDEDREFLKEIELLEAIINKIKHSTKQNHNPDVFWFKFSSLHPLSDLYGHNSTHVKEAKKILNHLLLHIVNIFSEMYNGNVFVNVITSDTSHTRRGRNILETVEDAPVKENDLNLATYYSPEYPVIFNIVLWFGVVMVFALLAICIAIGTMDPGRDSIIYRMTSIRMKKDN